MGVNFLKAVDYWGKEISSLKNKKFFLFDMDGTIYIEQKLFEGAKEFLEFIEDIGGRYVFITNNSSKSVKDYILKMNKLGIKADANNFFTSAQAAIYYLKRYYSGAKVYCQGTRSLIDELKNSGIRITEEVEQNVDIVLVGFDMELTSQKLRNTCELLQNEIPFIATNPDIRCPVDFGFVPDCGSICNMIEAATGKKPKYIGKPEPMMIDIVREKFGYSIEETVVIGDRLYTDIKAGLNAGVTSVCVLSGEASVKDIEEGEIKPTLTFYSVKEMWEAMLSIKMNDFSELF